MNKRYFDSLAGLRGIFILGIVLFHVQSYFEAPLEKFLSFFIDMGDI